MTSARSPCRPRAPGLCVLLAAAVGCQAAASTTGAATTGVATTGATSGGSANGTSAGSGTAAGGGATSASGATSGNGTATSGGGSGGFKPPLGGLVDMGNIDFLPQGAPVNDPFELAPYGADFGGFVVNVTWAQLEPTDAGLAPAPNALDEALAAVRAYNADAGLSVGVKLRVWGGANAPPWAMVLGGAPIALTMNHPVGLVAQEGRWWTAPYRQAEAAFQEALAARYDGEPLIQEVHVSACACADDEPTSPLRGLSNALTLQDAGYTDVAQIQCLNGALAEYAPWATTWRDFTFGSFFSMEPATHGEDDAGIALAVMQGCTTAAHCLLANHNLNSAQTLDVKDRPIYAEIAFLVVDAGVAGADFQTHAPACFDWCGAMLEAHALDGRSVEIWDHPTPLGFTALTRAQLDTLAQSLDTGTVPDPSLCPPVVDAGC